MYCEQVKLALAGLFVFIVLCEGCTQCGGQSTLTENSLSMEELKQVRIELIKKQILKKLRLSKPPSETRRFAVPNVITDEDGVLGELKKASKDDEDDYYATTQNVIVFADEIYIERINDSSVISTTMRFLIDTAAEFPQGVSSAHLWIYTYRQNASRISYFLYDNTFNNGTVEPGQILHVDHVTENTPSDWRKYDVTTVVKDRLDEKSQIIFSISCHGCDNEFIATVRNFQPFVIIGTDPSSRTVQRRKRHIECSTNTIHCCREDFYLSFREIGWDDWIVFPPGYKANFCRGYCGFDISLSKYTHTIIMQNVMQNQLHGKIDRNVSVELCCSPSKLSSISLMYQRDNLTYTEHMPNMVVESCGCA